MITRATLSTIEQGLPKYRSMLAGNNAFVPSSFESIATFTATGGETTFEFTSIPSTYVALQIRLITKDTNTGANGGMILPMFFNGATSGYAHHAVRGDGTAVASEQSSSVTYAYVYEATNRTTSGGTLFNAAIINILDYASTTKTKTYSYISGGDNNANTQDFRVTWGSGSWSGTAAITAIKFNANITAFYAGTKIALYGIKG